MIQGLAFLGFQAIFLLIGLPAAFTPFVRRLSFASRAAAAFAAGTIAATLWSIAMSMMERPWSIANTIMPLLIASAVLTSVMVRRRGAADVEEVQDTGDGGGVLPWILIAVAVCHVGLVAASSRATSSDYVFFWGVKGARFGEAQRIDDDFLRYPLNVHAHRSYPPLVPVTYAWSTWLSGKMSWRFGLLGTALWFGLTIPLLIDLLTTKLGRRSALNVAALWSLAMALAIGDSLSVGNAEVPLLFFLSIAICALLVEERKSSALRVLAAVSIGGALLTKAEGLIAFGCLAFSAVVRDFIWRDRRWKKRAAIVALVPAVLFALWPSFLVMNFIGLSDPTHSETLVTNRSSYADVVIEMARRLDSGSYWVVWIFCVAVLLTLRRRFLQIAPATVLIGGVLWFLSFYYLRHPGELGVWIEWSLPRVVQPALSALILAAGVVCFAREEPAATSPIVANTPRSDAATPAANPTGV